MTRRLTAAFLSGLAVFVLLNLTAWFSLRDERNVCLRQSRTRDSLMILTNQIYENKKKTGQLPK